MCIDPVFKETATCFCVSSGNIFFMRYNKLIVFFVACIAVSCQTKTPFYKVSDQSIADIDDRIFGAFFEKATWDHEIGADAAISLKTKAVFPEVLDYMKWMNIPVVRFPGGTAIDYYPWYNLIDHMPGHHDQRPANLHYEAINKEINHSSDGRMGLHEFMTLCGQTNMEPMLVVNVGDAYFHKKTIEEAAQNLGADFVSYCNDTEGRWADLRAKNGHPAPFAVKYWQIGNEPWAFKGLNPRNRNAESVKQYAQSMIAYAKAMKAADPTIQLFIDATDDNEKQILAAIPNDIDYLTFHSYTPWGIRNFKKDNQPIDPQEVSDKAVWQALVAAPFIDQQTGYSKLNSSVLQKNDKPLAVTEWNWNGWFDGEAKSKQPANELLAYGLGAGSYLHAIMRQADKIKVANQSMLLGTGWKISGIRVDTTEQQRPIMYPSAMVTGLYSRHHGQQLLPFEGTALHYYEQPFKLSLLKPQPKVAEQDIVITADAQHYYLHILNRSYDEKRPLTFEFEQEIADDYTEYRLAESDDHSMSPYAGITTLNHQNYNSTDRQLTVCVSPKSIAIFKIQKDNR